MQDSISRQAAIDCVTVGAKPTTIRGRLAELPSVQPEVIRCKDCMHNGSFDTDCPIEWGGKEYCSFAERKEE